jgi:O-antigen ligase
VALRFGLPNARPYIGDAPLVWCLTAGVLVAALVFGGGRVHGLRSDALVQLLSLPLLGVVLSRLISQPLWAAARWPLIITGAVLALPLLQLVPLPPLVWTLMPGREIAAESFRAAGLGLPWWPMSLHPQATWRSFLSLLPAVAIFLSVIAMGARGRRSLTLVVIAIAMVAVILGLAQLMQGYNSQLRFYEITNQGSSVGFFANRNHHAAFLYSVILIAAAWASGIIYDRQKSWRLGLIWCGLIFAALLIGLAMTRSLAGILLGTGALVLAILIADAGRPGLARRHALAAMVGIGIVAAILVVHFAWTGLSQQLFERDVITDFRFKILPIAWEAARSFLPFGSGFGTFELVYLMYDRPEALLGREYVNHAHNDWLELLIEGGVLAVALLACFAIWFLAAAGRIWRRNREEASYLDVALARAASGAILLIGLHALAEFPLRNTAMLSLFALFCALLVMPPAKPERVRHRSRRGHDRLRTPAGSPSAPPQGNHTRPSRRSPRAPAPPGRLAPAPAIGPGSRRWEP